MKKKTKNKVIFLNIFIILVLLFLAYSATDIDNFPIILIYASTWILVLHIWLGAYYIVRYLEPEDSVLNVGLDAISLGSMIFAVWFLQSIIVWSLFFATLFASAMFKYWNINKNTKDEKKKTYTNKKIRNEIISVPLFLLLSLFAYLFKGNDTVILWVSIVVFLFQIFFLVWLISIKKVYGIFKS